jgi:diacylglycerol kinase (ATP)
MNILLVYNPFAGFRKSEKVLPEVQQTLSDKGINHDLLLTKARGDATKLVKEADLSKYDAVISSGGDGTFHEVLNGYYQNKGKTKPPIGIIPNGTGNAFATELGLKGFEFKKAIDIISKKNIKKIDVGYCETQTERIYFHNIIGFGMVTDINQSTNKYKKLGSISYTIATLEKILFLKTFPLEIVLDGKTIKQDNIFVEIANTRYTGADFLMAPEAIIDDGLFDVVLSRKTSRFNVLKLLLQVFKGKHIFNKDIDYIKASSITVKTKEAKLLTPDGESYGSTPLTVSCKKQYLEFLWE